MREIRHGFLFLVLCFCLPLAGQHYVVTDSLEQLLDTRIADSSRCRIYLQLADQYKLVDSTYFNQSMKEAYILAEAMENTRCLGWYYKLLGEKDMHHGLYQEALISYDRAQAFFNEANDNNGYYETLKEKGNIHLFQGEFERALNYYETALDYYKRKGQLIGASRCLNNMGIIYKNRGEYVEALTVYDESIKMIDEEEDPLQVAQGYINMGNVFVYLGAYERALEHFVRAMDLAEQAGSFKETALSTMNSGVVQNKCGKYKEALEFYMRSLEMGRKLDDPILISNCLINIGTNYGQMGKPEEGLQYVEQGKEIKEELGDRRAISNCLIHLSEIHLLLDSLDRAKSLLEEALPRKIELEDQEGQIRCYLGLANVAYQKGRYSSALQRADQAQNLASDIQALEHETTAFSIKRDVAEARGDFRSAYEFNLLYNTYNDSLVGQATSLAVMEMEFRHRSRALGKENENLKIQSELNAQLMKKRVALIYATGGIALLLLGGLLIVAYLLRRLRYQSLKLEEKNLVITRQNLKLDAMNQTKDRMMSIIAHDLRGTMGNQITAIDLLSRIEGVEKPELDRKKLLGNLKLSATYSLELLENLLLWSRLDETDEYYRPEELDVLAVASSCTALSEEAAHRKDISLFTDMEKDLIIYADRIMLETIFRNLLSNALKFSEKGGKVRLAARKIDSTVEIVVEDQGIGMNKEELYKLLNNGGYTRRGTENEKGAGIGMTLIRELTSLHQGELDIRSETGKGTRVILKFPCKN